MLRVGLTGGIASGKTAVSDLLAEHGAVIIDSDLLAREAVGPGTACLARVAARFGDDLIVDGRLDRARLGQIVFADPDARRDLEAIIHPAVRARAAELSAQAPADAIVVQVIPLLVETGQQDSFDRVVVIDIDPAIQLERLIARNGLTISDAQARIDAQATRADRLAAADLVIDNSGSPEDLAAQVSQVWAQLRDAASRQ